MVLMDISGKEGIHRECLIWFATRPFHPKGYEIVEFKEAGTEVSGGLFSPETFETLFSDLSAGDVELFQQLSKGNRRDVRVAKKRGWSVKWGNSPDDIKCFHDEHSAFVAAKGICGPYHLDVLLRNAAYCRAAFVQDHSGKLICWNFYICDKPITRLWYAGSDQSQNKTDRGFASSLLHWEMMLQFKQEGYATYDWGGAATDPASPTYSITQFKRKFGGAPGKRFNYRFSLPPSPSRQLWLVTHAMLGMVHQYCFRNCRPARWVRKRLQDS